MSTAIYSEISRAHVAKINFHLQFIINLNTFQAFLNTKTLEVALLGNNPFVRLRTGFCFFDETLSKNAISSILVTLQNGFRATRHSGLTKPRGAHNIRSNILVGQYLRVIGFFFLPSPTHGNVIVFFYITMYVTLSTLCEHLVPTSCQREYCTLHKVFPAYTVLQDILQIFFATPSVFSV